MATKTVAGSAMGAPAKTPPVNGETFPTTELREAAAFDFEDVGEQIKSLLSLAVFVERTRHLTGELEAAADRNTDLQRLLSQHDIPYSDAYFMVEESAGLRTLLRHAQQLAAQAQDAGVTLVRQAKRALT